MDFDDLIMQTIRLFETKSKNVAILPKQIHYIHVDEYQDTNQAQYQLVTMLAKGFRNLCVVGDSVQRICGLAGARHAKYFEF